MKNEITNALESGKNSMVEIRGEGGKKLLTLSFRKKQGFRFFKGAKPGGGGRKHTPCNRQEAENYILHALADGGVARLS